MSLVGTLGKIAMGVMVAKGVGKMLNGAKGGGGLGGLLGGLTGGMAGQGSASAGQTGSSIPDIGDLLGGSSKQGGGLGGMLDSLGGGTQSGGSLGGMLNDALGGSVTQQPTREVEDQARVMLRAMLSAAKSDGNIDAQEQANITKHLDELSAEDSDFIRAELDAPVDVDRVVNSVPSGMEQQAYLMSLLAIDLDSQAEAQYLDKLAKGLNISHQMADTIHAELGVPKLYS